eukprot:scaffold249965_cov33-Tisochrysis_lutea.AAC.2
MRHSADGGSEVGSLSSAQSRSATPSVANPSTNCAPALWEPGLGTCALPARQDVRAENLGMPGRSALPWDGVPMDSMP